MAEKLFATLLCVLIIAVNAVAQNDPPKATTPGDEKKTAVKVNKRPQDPPKKPEPFDKADVKTMAAKCVTLNTEKGKVEIELFPESAPESVRNFLNLVATKALDTTTFSRVVPNFVIQGGDLYTSQNLTIDLKWRAVRTIPDEPSLIKHERGIVSMARGEEPNSASTSFFILVSKAETLDNKFAAFGRVIKGMDVVDAINKMSVENETPKEPVRITTAVVSSCNTAEENSESTNTVKN
ncbi:MAG: peptidylprolyl isomerase [Pyrinomonadaceae bacterium]|nr:peptidylprolyl isomerase [Pyrinomonadaceae bacterium]